MAVVPGKGIKGHYICLPFWWLLLEECKTVANLPEKQEKRKYKHGV